MPNSYLISPLTPLTFNTGFNPAGHKVHICLEYYVPRQNWTSPPPFPQASVYLQPGTKGGGGHSPAGKGVGGPITDDWRKSLALCLLCAAGHIFHGGRGNDET